MFRRTYHPRVIYLIDASVYVFRAYYSMPPDMTDRDGHPAHATFGFARFLGDLIERAKPHYIAVAFDESLTTSFRNQIYPAYKANRDPAPDALKRQFVHCQALCRALGLAVLSDSRYEADDLIGSAIVSMRGHGYRGVIVSADKDLSQLLDTHDELRRSDLDLRIAHPRDETIALPDGSYVEHDMAVVDAYDVRRPTLLALEHSGAHRDRVHARRRGRLVRAQTKPQEQRGGSRNHHTGREYERCACASR